MVVANEPTVVDFVVVIEATANMVAHWNAIKKKYILPAVEYFNGRRPSSTDYIGNNGSSQFGYVLFHSYDNSAELFASCSSVTQSPWDFVHSIDSISFSGGGCEQCSSIAEGLGRALQVFDDLARRRGNGQSTKVCLLVCNSPPYDLPCYENYMYAGQKSENLAELMGKKGIHLSVISPQHIPQVKQLYLTANHNKSMTLNYAQDPRHLVLISGFTLPTEQDPIKVEPKEGIVLASAVTNNATATSSVSSTAVQHPSPVSSFSHPNQSVAVNSPAGLMQPSNPVSQTLSGDVKSSAGMPSLSTSTAQNSNGLTISSGMTASASITIKPQTTVNMISQVNQQQQQMSSYSSDGNISQAVSNSSFSRPSFSQNSASGNVMTNARICANTVSSNMKDMVQPVMNQPQSSEAQMRMSDMTVFSSQQANHMRNNNMRPSTSGSPANALPPTGANQGMFSPQSTIKNAAIPDQKRMTTQSVASHLAESSAGGTSNNMPLVPAYSNSSLPSNNMQIGQVQQKNSLVSATSNETISSFSVSSSNSIQQMSSGMNNSQPMINRGNNIHPSMPQNSLMTPTPGNMNMITSNDQQIASNSMQIEQPMNQPQSIASSNVPSMNRMPNNDQAPNVVVLPNQPNSVPLWRGILEWKEKRRVPSGTSERTTHHLQCEIFARPNQNDDALNVTSWPNTLTMQLVPHVVFSYRNLKAQIRNHISVSLRMTPIDQMTHLASTMQNKWMGVVQTQATPNPQAENRVMLVLYSQKNNHFVGLLPRDPATFISTIKQVIHMHQNQPRQPNPGGPQLGQPLQNVGPSQFSPDNRMPIQSVPNQNHFIVQNTRNTNPVMRPMNQMPVQQNRGLTNPNMQVRQSIQMQPGVSTPARMGFSPAVQRIPGNGQMANPQSMMSPQIQQQSNLGTQMQPGGGGNQQYMYQNNMNPRQMAPSRPVMNQSNPDVVRQQQLQRIRMQHQQQQQQQQQSQQFNRINQMPASHNAGEEQLRSLLQQAGNPMTQGMNQQRPAMHPPNQGMRQIHQGSVRPNYISNQQMRHPMQSTRMMGMQQQRFGSDM